MMFALKTKPRQPDALTQGSPAVSEPQNPVSCAGLSGVEKAALLMMSIGASASAEVFKKLSREHIARLTAGIASMPAPDDTRRVAVFAEFEQARRDSISAGGSVASALLESMLTAENRGQADRRPEAPTADPRAILRSFDELGSLDEKALAAVLDRVGARTLAAALAGADPRFRASLLGKLTPEDKVRLRAQMDQLGPVRLRDIEEAQDRCIRTISDTSGSLVLAEASI